MNASQGQTGFWITAFLGGGLLLLKTRPMLAGALIGLLAIKPQFAVLTPLLMILAGNWRALTIAALTAALFAVVATVALGSQTGPHFFGAAGAARAAPPPRALPPLKGPPSFSAPLPLGRPAAHAPTGPRPPTA